MNWKALSVGVLSYPLLWLVWSLLSPQYEHEIPKWYTLIFDAFYLLLPVISGFLGGYLAKDRGMQHGALIGAVIAMLSLALWGVSGVVDLTSITAVIFPMLILFALSVIGGVLSQWRGYLKMIQG